MTTDPSITSDDGAFFFFFSPDPLSVVDSGGPISRPRLRTIGGRPRSMQPARHHLSVVGPSRAVNGIGTAPDRCCIENKDSPVGVIIDMEAKRAPGGKSKSEP